MLHKREFKAMGSQIFVALDNGDSPLPPAELDDVPNWFEEWEQALSRFRPDSELSRVNRQAGTPTKVSQVFAEVFETALYVEKASGGLVSPLLLNALAQLGYDRSFDLLPIQAAFSAPKRLFLQPSLDEIIWDADMLTISLPHDMKLDFGGIAKGWAALRAAEKLGQRAPALVNAGGDIAVGCAPEDGVPWQVGVTNPFDPSQEFEFLKVESCGVATSGRDKRRWLQGDHWNHHIIDPRTGLSAETDILRVTVVAPSVIEAELAAKTILISGVENGLAWLAENPDLAGMLVLESGECLYSEKMEEYLWS